MVNKKEFLLDTIIQAYIRHLEPIGSGQLKTMYDIAYSPATIRGYFKKLCDEGYLTQEHASSGRTPTTEALKEYWGNRLGKLNDTSFTITVAYNSALYKFLSDMVGLEASNVLDVARQVGARELYYELTKYLFNRDFEIINIKGFLNLCVQYDLDENYINHFLNGNVMNNLKSGLYFHDHEGINKMLPNEYMGIVQEVSIENKNYTMLVVGMLSKDYEYFFKRII
ncbi:MAG: heat-shock protein [Campylobacterales bacterium]|nr:heat-shock protein [Campylobacterales bacterium]